MLNILIMAGATVIFILVIGIITNKTVIKSVGPYQIHKIKDKYHVQQMQTHRYVTLKIFDTYIEADNFLKDYIKDNYESNEFVKFIFKEDDNDKK